MARIFLFGSAVMGLLFVTFSYAFVNGQIPKEQPSGSPGATASVAPSGQPSPSVSGEGNTVAIANLSFGANLTVAAGTSVTFTNNDIVPHTATNGTDGKPAPDALFDIDLPVGASGSYTFAQPGAFPVTCTLHPTMNMTITVQ